MNLFYRFFNLNVGKKVSFFASILSIIMDIVAVWCGFSLIAQDEDLAFVGLAIVTFGIIVSHIIGTFLDAFGKLVDKTIENECNTSFIVEFLKKYDQKAEIKPTSTYSVAPEQKATDEVANDNGIANPVKTARVTVNENNTMLCPLCNFEQPANRKVCWHCGAKFEEEIPTTGTLQWLCYNCKK